MTLFCTVGSGKFAHVLLWSCWIPGNGASYEITVVSPSVYPSVRLFVCQF